MLFYAGCEEKSDAFMTALVWVFFVYCGYQAYVAITTKVVLGFGAKGSVVPIYFSYDEHPVGYFLFLGFYLAISAAAILAALRKLRGR